MMAVGSVTTFICIQRILIEKGWESRRRTGISLASERHFQLWQELWVWRLWGVE